MQAESLHGEWKSEKAQRISLTERIIKQGAELTDQQLQHQAAVVRIRYVCVCCSSPLPRKGQVLENYAVLAHILHITIQAAVIRVRSGCTCFTTRRIEEDICARVYVVPIHTWYITVQHGCQPKQVRHTAYSQQTSQLQLVVACH